MSQYGRMKKVDYSFEEAISKTKDALDKHGFGVLSEIDVSKKLEEKIGADFDDYMILGACNPDLAYQALQKERELGLLLPCNVIVYKDGDDVFVSAIKATKALEITGNDELNEIAENVESQLQTVIEEV